MLRDLLPRPSAKDPRKELRKKIAAWESVTRKKQPVNETWIASAPLTKVKSVLALYESTEMQSALVPFLVKHMDRIQKGGDLAALATLVAPAPPAASAAPAPPAAPAAPAVAPEPGAGPESDNIHVMLSNVYDAVNAVGDQIRTEFMQPAAEPAGQIGGGRKASHHRKSKSVQFKV